MCGVTFHCSVEVTAHLACRGACGHPSAPTVMPDNCVQAIWSHNCAFMRRRAVLAFERASSCRRVRSSFIIGKSEAFLRPAGVTELAAGGRGGREGGGGGGLVGGVLVVVVVWEWVSERRGPTYDHVCEMRAGR